MPILFLLDSSNMCRVLGVIHLLFSITAWVITEDSTGSSVTLESKTKSFCFETSNTFRRNIAKASLLKKNS